ncbi:MAG: Rrf2 family transcriptional regulator [Bryobacteraceae bacterium]|nr:Rrf2 family transcriptional regulator [Bryobacteraceae bacterium]
MQLTLHADYAFRVLVYLGTHPGRLVTTQEISTGYGISKNHLVRVIHTLAEHKHVAIQPGRSGGITLARELNRIRLGDVIRQAEPNLRLVECFAPDTNTCPIAPVCSLKGMLNEALNAFIENLNRYTVADVIDRSGSSRLTSAFAVFADWNTANASRD